MATPQSTSPSSGRLARQRVPRSRLALWQPSLRAFADPVDVVAAHDHERIPELVPERYRRMLASPFAFFRGTAELMAADLSTSPHSGLTVQLCGDAHLMNFGGFNAPDRVPVFDLNDFDETLPGPFEWDLKRLAASLAVAGRHRGLRAPQRAAVVRACVDAYRTSIKHLSAADGLATWYERLTLDDIESTAVAVFDAADVERFRATRARAERRDHQRAVRKLAVLEGGRWRIRNDPPLLTSIDELARATGYDASEVVASVLAHYRRSLSPDRRTLLDRYEYVDAGRKVVGVGSVGTRCWIALLVDRSTGAPLVLQLKEAGRSALEGPLPRSRYRHHGRRVIEGQRLIQSTADVMLGVASYDDRGTLRQFYVRQMWDGKGSVDIDALSAKSLAGYGEICGRTLARAHARAGSAVDINDYLGNSTAVSDAMCTFAETYADQVEHDYALLKGAAASGRITVAAEPAA